MVSLPSAGTDVRQQNSNNTPIDELIQCVHRQFIQQLDLEKLAQLGQDELREEIDRLLSALCDDACKTANIDLDIQARQQVQQAVVDETFGLGPLERHLCEPTNRAIIIESLSQVLVETDAGLELTDICFRDIAHLKDILYRIDPSMRGCDLPELGQLSVAIRREKRSPSQLTVTFQHRSSSDGSLAAR